MIRKISYYKQVGMELPKSMQTRVAMVEKLTDNVHPIIK